MKRNIGSSLLLLALCALSQRVSTAEGTADAAAPTGVPEWCMGPFTRPANAQPIISPDTNSVFNCPLRKAPVHWEYTHTFNPAAVVKDGKVCLLYRAEDNTGAKSKQTARLGLAVSEDGIHFTKMAEPVFFPAEDDQTYFEWEGGCEDPRLVETEDGTYVLLYTQVPRGHGTARLGMATSKDLLHWNKLGPVIYLKEGVKVAPRKSASLVCKVTGGRLIATKINGRYWMYVGEGSIGLLSSEDLNNWESSAKRVIPDREGKFDGAFQECGPPALLTDKGIVLLFNAKTKGEFADMGVGDRAYCGTQALFSATDPSKLLDRLEVPFIKPELPWEKTGNYSAGTTFIEGLVLFKNQWFLYYGCADTFVGVATAPVQPWQLRAPAGNGTRQPQK